MKARRAPTQPDAIRLAYYRELRDGVVRPAVNLTRNAMAGLVAYRGDDERYDAFLDRARSALANLRARIAESVTARAQQAANLVRRIFGRVNVKSQTDVERQVRGPVPPVNLATVADAFVGENVALITSIPEKMLSEVEQLILRATTSGATRRDLAQELQRRYDITENRAKLIARDQVGKLYGQLAMERQRSLGITHFVWRTQRDNRVRDSHAELEGTTWAWASPPDIGVPGEPINCRCSAEPVI